LAAPSGWLATARAVVAVRRFRPALVKLWQGQGSRLDDGRGWWDSGLGHASLVPSV